MPVNSPHSSELFKQGGVLFPEFPPKPADLPRSKVFGHESYQRTLVGRPRTGLNFPPNRAGCRQRFLVPFSMYPLRGVRAKCVVRFCPHYFLFTFADTQRLENCSERPRWISRSVKSPFVLCDRVFVVHKATVLGVCFFPRGGGHCKGGLK